MWMFDEMGWASEAPLCSGEDLEGSEKWVGRVAMRPTVFFCMGGLSWCELVYATLQIFFF